MKCILLLRSKAVTEAQVSDEAAPPSHAFEKELNILNSLRHPYIVSLEAWGISSIQVRDETLTYGCIVMEFMAGGSLEDRLFGAMKSTPLTSIERIRIAAEMSLAPKITGTWT